jgi:uncharacterized protein YbcI
MANQTDSGALALQAVSNALVRLHKVQFGRGPANARTFFAGPDGLVCVLEDALLPAERKLVALGRIDRVRDSRAAFQAATQEEFVAAVEEITDRKVIAFASAVDPQTSVVFENYVFAPSDRTDGGPAA